MGADNTTKKTIEIFKNKKELGYIYIGFFSNKKSNKNEYLGAIKDSFNFILNENIDEVYCSLTELNNEEIKEVKTFSKKHGKIIKLIPNASELYNKNLVAEFYDDSIVILKVIPNLRSTSF